MNYDNGTLELSLVDVCTCLCSYCPQKALKQGYVNLGHNADFKKPIEMCWDTFTTILSKVPKGVVIDFAGFVEPFHSSRCADMMCYVHDQGYRIRLFTTISGMKYEYVDKIKHIPLVDCCYHVPDNMNILKVDVTDEYIRVVDHFLKHIKCSAHCFGPVHDKLKWVDIRCRIQNMKLNQEHLINRGGNLKTTKTFQVRELEKKKGKLWCKSPYMMRGGATGRLNFNVCDIFGNVYLCCCSFGLQHKLGNLLTDNYEDLFASEEYNRVIAGLNGDESINILCRTCDMSVSQ